MKNMQRKTASQMFITTLYLQNCMFFRIENYAVFISFAPQLLKYYIIWKSFVNYAGRPGFLTI